MSEKNYYTSFKQVEDAIAALKKELAQLAQPSQTSPANPPLGADKQAAKSAANKYGSAVVYPPPSRSRFAPNLDQGLEGIWQRVYNLCLGDYLSNPRTAFAVKAVIADAIAFAIAEEKHSLAVAAWKKQQQQFEAHRQQLIGQVAALTGLLDGKCHYCGEPSLVEVCSDPVCQSKAQAALLQAEREQLGVHKYRIQGRPDTARR